MNCDPILQSVTAFFKIISSVPRRQASLQRVADKTTEDLISGMNNVFPFYQHGFGIVVGEESQGHIIVDGGKNSSEFASATDACVQG